MKTFIMQLWTLMAPKRRRIACVLGIIVVFEAMKLLPPVLFKQVLDTITGGLAGKSVILVQLAFAVFVAEMALSTVHLWFDRWVLDILFWAERYLPIQVQHKLLALSLGYHERQQTGEKITQLDRGTDKLVEFIAHVLWQFIPLIVQIGWTMIVLSIIDPIIALVFTAAIPVFIAMTWHLHVKAHPYRSQQEDLFEESSGRLGESVINIKTVQAFAQEHRERGIYAGLRDTIETLGRTRMIQWTRMNLWRSLVVNLARLGIIVLAGYKALHGQLSLGSVVLLLTLSEKVYISLFSLNQILDRMVEATEPLRRVLEVLNTRPDIAQASDPIRPVEFSGRIAFDDVSFSYGAGMKKALNGVAFTIEPGETVALAGPSGGGKSTIVKLLLRYYDPTDGKILLDGLDLRTVDLSTARRAIGYVPQEVEVMSGTVWDNITYGNPDATEEDVLRVARLAHVDEFASKFPQGYKTMVGERGMKLSGGQRQRVGIARALLTNPPILVFDEATSNLDAAAERAIQDALAQVAGQKTLIIIAHRLSTIMKADKIIVVERGRISEVGTHAELMKRNGMYERLVHLQLHTDESGGSGIT